MLYFANPCGDAVIAAMVAGELGLIDTPGQRKTTETNAAHAAGVTWCADNGAFSDRFDETKWWRFLVKNSKHAATCAFAVAPDVVGDAVATLERSRPWLGPIRRLGYPVAFVAQDGSEVAGLIPWDEFDVLFIGGTDDFKLGPAAREVVRRAKDRGKAVHMGRVNSAERFRYALFIGCDSVDGTFLTFGPDTNLPRLRRWHGVLGQGDLLGGVQ